MRWCDKLSEVFFYNVEVCQISVDFHRMDAEFLEVVAIIAAAVIFRISVPSKKIYLDLDLG